MHTRMFGFSGVLYVFVLNFLLNFMRWSFFFVILQLSISKILSLDIELDPIPMSLAVYPKFSSLIPGVRV